MPLPIYSTKRGVGGCSMNGKTTKCAEGSRLGRYGGRKARRTESFSNIRFGSVTLTCALRRDGDMCLAKLRCRCPRSLERPITALRDGRPASNTKIEIYTPRRRGYTPASPWFKSASIVVTGQGHGGRDETLSDFAHLRICRSGLPWPSDSGQQQQAGQESGARCERRSLAGPHCPDQYGSVKPERSWRAIKYGEQ